MKKQSKLTKWEVGQELTKVNDSLHKAIEELKDYPDIQKALKRARLAIVRAYDEAEMVEEMKFGI